MGDTNAICGCALSQRLMFTRSRICVMTSIHRLPVARPELAAF